MIALTSDPIDLARLLAAVGSPEHGGTALFVGSTRREEHLRSVERLTYEAYEELALAEMAAVAEEARARFGAFVAVVHRTGAVEIGEPSVAVAASAGHRPEAFAACRYVIDEVKRRVPIWKRTDYADGASSWVDGCAHDHVRHREAQRA